MKIIKKKYCVLYFVCVFLLILLNSCDLLFNSLDCGCVPPPPSYSADLAIRLREIKDSRVKSIKITLKNLDGIAPEFNVYEKEKGLLKKKQEIYSVTEQKRDKYVLGSSDDGETYYFKDVNVDFEPIIPRNRKTLRKRVYELKTYINDGLFFTKKISVTPKRNEEGDLYDYYDSYIDKVEVDNMDYVKKRDDTLIIKLTDTDIKDIL